MEMNSRMKAAREKGPDHRQAPLRSDSAERRRRGMLSWIRNQASPVQGGDLARRFRVSRQCVVQDIAILRASGTEILATPSGYRLPQQSSRPFRAILACRHT